VVFLHHPVLMDITDNPALHTFHVPVRGLCFSIDTPLKVARYGISSVVSIIEDELIEDMRAYHSLKNGIAYTPIPVKEPDYRARRITAYLDLLDDLVAAQAAALKEMPFTAGSDLVKHFELLPGASPLRRTFSEMMRMDEGEAKVRLQEQLRASVHTGAIDVNIMAKVDNAHYSENGTRLPDEYSDALSALRGFANSKLSSSVVFSAGYNPKLYSYTEQFDDFFPDPDGHLQKKIILKVSDYRSALVQGKIFAKKGLWVSEFRIESGLNCGGHAFPTEGLLLGPILEAFKANRSTLSGELAQLCNEALQAKGKVPFAKQPDQRITVQGGVGTAEEHMFLLQYFQLDSVGWGSPFLLVPEVTNVDDTTLHQLANAKKEDYFLSNASPLGVPFNNFRSSSSEAQRKDRIEKKRPGSPCYKKYLSSDTEFTDLPICTASREYQHLKEKQLLHSDLSADEKKAELDKVFEKDCLCEGLASSVRLKNEMYIPHKLSAVTICPGPNLAYFSGIFSLKEMTDHIYGRRNILNSLQRSHVFINELRLYIDYLKKKTLEDVIGLTDNQKRYYQKFKANLQQGIAYYRSLVDSLSNKRNFNEELARLELQLASITCK